MNSTVEHVRSPVPAFVERYRSTGAPLPHASPEKSAFMSYFQRWVSPLKEAPVFRATPDGIAIVMGHDATRFRRGASLVAFPHLDRAEWVDEDIVDRWPVVA